MEMIDVLDSDGTSSRQIVSKKEVHQKGLWHRTAHVWLVNSKGEILLQRRADDIESFPNKYFISAGGHLSAGDMRIEGALREVEEELGIKIIEKDLINIGEIRIERNQKNETYIDKEYCDIYILYKDIPVSDFIIQKSEVKYVKYVALSEFKKMILENNDDLVVPTEEECKVLFTYLDKNL
ncbi:MAG: NUDIX domain-containing protein [Candidatus Paceibacterota bacterium]